MDIHPMWVAGQLVQAARRRSGLPESWMQADAVDGLARLGAAIIVLAVLFGVLDAAVQAGR